MADWSMNKERTLKYLRESIPQGEHPTPHAEFISVRLDAVQNAIAHLERLIDNLEWTNKGIDEWRTVAVQATKQAAMSRATASVAITHLKNTLNMARTYDEHIKRTAALDWLTSIGE